MFAGTSKLEEGALAGTDLLSLVLAVSSPLYEYTFCRILFYLSTFTLNLVLHCNILSWNAPSPVAQLVISSYLLRLLYCSVSRSCACW